MAFVSGMSLNDPESRREDAMARQILQILRKHTKIMRPGLERIQKRVKPIKPCVKPVQKLVKPVKPQYLIKENTVSYTHLRAHET